MTRFDPPPKRYIAAVTVHEPLAQPRGYRKVDGFAFEFDSRKAARRYLAKLEGDGLQIREAYVFRIG
jgi:hypothetical protein